MAAINPLSPLAFWLLVLAFATFALLVVMPPSLVPKSRALPSKESGVFKEVLHYYEDRQLKKGLKAADTILKKFPQHGGMFVYHMHAPYALMLLQRLCA